MKTAKEIKDEISSIVSEIKELDNYKDKGSVALRKRLRKSIPKMRLYMLYMETNPSLDFLNKEKDRITSRISEIEKLYKEPDNPERFTKG